MPHVGIVVEVIDKNFFISCEAQIEGRVGEVRRNINQTICFGRPNFEVRPGKQKSADGYLEPAVVRLERLRSGSYADIYNVQRALERVAGLRNQRSGEYDTLTRSAYARWQRRLGYVGDRANGEPDQASLERLGNLTKVFAVSRSEF